MAAKTSSLHEKFKKKNPCSMKVYFDTEQDRYVVSEKVVVEARCYAQLEADHMTSKYKGFCEGWLAHKFGQD